MLLVIFFLHYPHNSSRVHSPTSSFLSQFFVLFLKTNKQTNIASNFCYPYTLECKSSTGAWTPYKGAQP